MSFYSDFAAHYERIFPFREVVLSYLVERLPKSPARVLDAGCGPGHYCGHLAETGLEAVGLDLDAEMITAARDRYPDAEFHHLDLVDASILPGFFDGALCLGNVAAHLDRDRLEQTLSALQAKMPAGAPWLVQTVNWDALLDRSLYVFPDRDLDGVVFQREYLEISDRSLVFRTRLIENGREIFAGEETLYPLLAADSQALHADLGFDLVSHHADFQGADFDPEQPGGSVMTFRRR
jgi:SAM-dependent methyltransferase